MTSRLNRFHGYGSLKFVYRRGETTRGPLFAIKVTPNPRRDQFRFAVVVSRKVHKSAVARNRIRRRLYEAMRLKSGQLKEPYDIVLTVYNDAVLNEDFSKLSKQLDKQLSQAGIIKK